MFPGRDWVHAQAWILSLKFDWEACEYHIIEFCVPLISLNSFGGDCLRMSEKSFQWYLVTGVVMSSIDCRLKEDQPLRTV